VGPRAGLDAGARRKVLCLVLVSPYVLSLTHLSVNSVDLSEGFSTLFRPADTLTLSNRLAGCKVINDGNLFTHVPLLSFLLSIKCIKIRF
jgi:hypothetical protein